MHSVEGLLRFAVVILAVDQVRAWLSRPRVRRGLAATTGSLIVVVGVALGLSRG